MSIFDGIFRRSKRETDVEDENEPHTYWAAVCDNCGTCTCGNSEVKYCYRCGNPTKWVELIDDDESNGD